MAGIDTKRRVGRWLRRYLPPEISSNALALLCAGAAYAAGGGALATVVAGTWGGSVGYYGLLLSRELSGSRGERSPLQVVLALVGEFGPAEALDCMLLRPALMYAATALAPNLAWGFALGKLAADLAFYLPAIVSYELLLRARRRTACFADIPPHPRRAQVD